MNPLFLTEKTSAISKVLSANDTGETGGHQAGILIPKQKNILSFFPEMGIETKNPRAKLSFIDSSGEEWRFSFIYYNNKFFGGTRNEYRLTGMTSFIRQHNLKAGDTVTLQRLEDGMYLLKYDRANAENSSVLRLGSTWKVVEL